MVPGTVGGNPNINRAGAIRVPLFDRGQPLLRLQGFEFFEELVRFGQRIGSAKSAADELHDRDFALEADALLLCQREHEEPL